MSSMPVIHLSFEKSAASDETIVFCPATEETIDGSKCVRAKVGSDTMLVLGTLVFLLRLT